MHVCYLNAVGIMIPCKSIYQRMHRMWSKWVRTTRFCGSAIAKQFSRKNSNNSAMKSRNLYYGDWWKPLNLLKFTFNSLFACEWENCLSKRVEWRRRVMKKAVNVEAALVQQHDSRHDKATVRVKNLNLQDKVCKKRTVSKQLLHAYYPSSHIYICTCIINIFISAINVGSVWAYLWQISLACCRLSSVASLPARSGVWYESDCPFLTSVFAS